MYRTESPPLWAYRFQAKRPGEHNLILGREPQQECFNLPTTRAYFESTLKMMMKLKERSDRHMIFCILKIIDLPCNHAIITRNKIRMHAL